MRALLAARARRRGAREEEWLGLPNHPLLMLVRATPCANGPTHVLLLPHDANWVVGLTPPLPSMGEGGAGAAIASLGGCGGHAWRLMGRHGLKVEASAVRQTLTLPTPQGIAWFGWARRHRCQQLRPPPPPPWLCPHDNTIATGLNKTTSAIIPVG